MYVCIYVCVYMRMIFQYCPSHSSGVLGRRDDVIILKSQNTKQLKIDPKKQNLCKSALHFIK